MKHTLIWKWFLRVVCFDQWHLVSDLLLMVYEVIAMLFCFNENYISTVQRLDTESIEYIACAKCF